MSTRPEISGTFGAAASSHWLASTTAMGILERGGNAADAAVAAGFVLQVVEPDMNGPGGEVPIIVWDPRESRASVVCGQGVAPAAASIDRFRGLGLDLVPGSGLLAAAVPGAFGGWTLLLEQWGTLELEDVLAPAIGYAENGWPLAARTADTIRVNSRMFAEDWPTSAAQWLRGGDAPPTGQLLTAPAVARTYRRVLDSLPRGGSREVRIAAAREIWYRGFVADEIVDFCRSTAWVDGSGDRHGGLLTAEDLAGWQPSVESPLTRDYHGLTVLKTGPWGQGPVFLQQLALLEGFDLDAMGVNSAEWLHTVVESAKLAFADREAWYGDPRFVDVPIEDLLTADYSRERRSLIGASASPDLSPGSPGGRSARLPRQAVHQAVDNGQHAGPGLITEGDTCYVAVADAHGMLVSATPSGGWLQSSPTIPELGFCLGSRLQMFWLEPDLPSSLRPGARPRTTLSPSLVLRGDEPWLAFGTPGGDMQDQWTLGFFLALVHGGLNLQEAVEVPLLHSEHFPSSFFPRAHHPRRVLAEDRIDAAVLDELSARGHDVVRSGPWSLGRTCAVSRSGGVLAAAASPRGGLAYAVAR